MAGPTRAPRAAPAAEVGVPTLVLGRALAVVDNHDVKMRVVAGRHRR